MNKLLLILLLGLNSFSFSAATILSVVDEGKEPKPEVDVSDRKIHMPNAIVDDKHKKLRHYPLTREQRPKSYTTPALQATMPGEIRYLHPSVSQVINRTTLPEYRLEAQIRTSERRKKGCLCVVFSILSMISTGSLILLYKCKS